MQSMPSPGIASRQMFYRFRLAAGVVWIASSLIPSAAFAQKEKLNESIMSRDGETWEAARKIWEWAEPGYQEHQSSKLLREMLAKAGFKIESGVAEIPTAFTATFGSGQPVIGILGEYDALPGLSQKAEPAREPIVAGGYGHGCGHH